jgi:ubiquitin-conjugating enzyme E2 O
LPYFKVEQPPFLVPASELKHIRMLNVFEPCTLQIGDRNFYTLKETDAVVSKAEWKRLEKEQLSKSKAGKAKKVGWL